MWNENKSRCDNIIGNNVEVNLVIDLHVWSTNTMYYPSKDILKIY